VLHWLQQTARHARPAPQRRRPAEDRRPQRPAWARPRAESAAQRLADHRYATAATMYQHAYDHMFMTGDLLAGAIAKQKNLK
jgi:hypothetical protein